MSATDCIAVGGGNRAFTQVQHWNGTKWSITSWRGGGLSAVSCVSAVDCTAVGYAAYAEQWNGMAWSLIPARNPPRGGGLFGVSCVSAVDCTAVGLIGNDAGGSTNGNARPGDTLVEHWNGTKWSIVHAPNPLVGGELMGVSCVTAADCTAVGNSFGVRGGHTYNKSTLVERWNGTKWSITTSPASGVLHGVSCLSATDCIAVGEGGPSGGTLVERWNGHRWSILPSPNPPGGGLLSGVSCVSATDCTAVGTGFDAPVSGPQVNVPLVELWNGKKWSLVPSPNPPGGGLLSGVSCVSARCAAVGDRGSGSRTLVEQGS